MDWEISISREICVATSFRFLKFLSNTAGPNQYCDSVKFLCLLYFAQNAATQAWQIKKNQIQHNNTCTHSTQIYKHTHTPKYNFLNSVLRVFD